MKEKLAKIKSMAEEALESAKSAEALEELRIRFLGKKGELTSVMKGMGALSPEERPRIGQLANEVRDFIGSELEKQKTKILEAAQEQKIKDETIDVTIPGKSCSCGGKHPLTLALEDLEDIFIGMGFSIAEGPEVELDYYNFEALNIPKDHPARDTQDTFYINDNVVLRTQTSPVQVRTMEIQKPPIRIISPGRVYRSDAVDATHSPVFHQVEGLVIDKGWIEILGCGMVHPKVLKNCGIDPDVYSGFAFGIGLERVTQFRYDVTDMRLYYENDVRFLDQF